MRQLKRESTAKHSGTTTNADGEDSENTK